MENLPIQIEKIIWGKEFEEKTLDEKIKYINGTLNDTINDLIREKYTELTFQNHCCYSCGKWSLAKDLIKEDYGIEELTIINPEGKEIEHWKKRIIKEKCPFCGYSIKRVKERLE